MAQDADDGGDRAKRGGQQRPLVVRMEQHEAGDGGKRQPQRDVGARSASRSGRTSQRRSPQVPISTSSVSTSCGQPVVTTMFERVKIAKVISVIGRQIFSASHIVRMKDASAMRAETAAVSEVGGDNSPQTDSRKTKKCATQGLTPRFDAAAAR